MRVIHVIGTVDPERISVCSVTPDTSSGSAAFGHGVEGSAQVQGGVGVMCDKLAGDFVWT